MWRSMITIETLAMPITDIIIAKHSLAQMVIILWKVGGGVSREGQVFIVGK